MRNVDALLELADKQAKLDAVAQLRAPALRFIDLLNKRAKQLSDNPNMERDIINRRDPTWGSW